MSKMSHFYKVCVCGGVYFIKIKTLQILQVKPSGKNGIVANISEKVYRNKIITQNRICVCK